MMHKRRTNLKNLTYILSITLSFLSIISSSGIMLYAQSSAEFRLTEGRSEKGYFIRENIPRDINNSGFRLNCQVSHYSYNDPITNLGQPDSSDLNVFVGNTAIDHNSTAKTLVSDGNSTCEGGLLDKTGYWMPALYDEDKNVVVPESVRVFYKAHFDTRLVNVVPNNLQLIGKQSIQGCDNGQLKCSEIENINGKLQLSVSFPNCLKVNKSKPVVTSDDNSHGVFSHVGCPKEYPYRIPNISTSFTYAVDPNSDWRLASDLINPNNPSPQGSSLHANLFTSWGDETRNKILECHREQRNCTLISVEDKLVNLEGERVYQGSQYTGDPTVFGMKPPVLVSFSQQQNQAEESDTVTQKKEQAEQVPVDSGKEEPLVIVADENTSLLNRLKSLLLELEDLLARLSVISSN